MAQHFDAIVIGLGGMGSAAAYYLSLAKQRVLLLEQFELDHQKGSSYGVARLIRYTYDNPIYINLMRAAYPLWFALEEKAGEKLYFKTGGIDFGLPTEPTLQQLFNSMDSAGLSYQKMTAAEASQHYPQIRFDEGMQVLYQEDSGFLAASKCVLAHTRLAQAMGATLIDRTPVTKILISSNSVEVQTASETYVADRIVLTTGSWAETFLAPHGIELPLRIMPCQVGFFAPDNSADYQPGRFPVFLAHMTGDYGEEPYAIPTYQGFGVKIYTFYGLETVSHPSEVDYTPDPQWTLAIRRFLRQYVPGANGPLLSTRRCLYTMTPDKHFIIDRHPEHPKMVFAAGFSGHGFKFSTLVGKILSELLLEVKPNMILVCLKYHVFKNC